MPLDLPIFQPQVQGGSITPIRPYDDFSESVAKGYQVGRILAGIPQQEDQLKLDRMRQQLIQSEQSFPLEQQKLVDEHQNLPYSRSKIVSDILNTPGAVSNVSKGPVIPVGNDPFSQTMRFAAPEGNGQVPSDTVPLDVPGKDIGISPSEVQKYLMTKARHPDNSTNLTFKNTYDPADGTPLMLDKQGNWHKNGEPYHGPMTKAYAPKLVGQIDDRPVMFNPTDRSIVFNDTKEPVSAEEWKNFVQLGGPTLTFQANPDGKMFGFATRGPNQAQGVEATIPTTEPTPAGQEPKQVPFTKDSPQAEKIQNELRNLKDSTALLTQMKDEWDQVNKKGHVGILAGNLTRGANILSGGSFDPQAQIYQRNKKAFTASLRGMTGDDSRFSDADREALLQSLASIEENPKVGKQQWDFVFGLLNKRQKIRWQDEKLGKKTPAEEQLSIQEPPNQTTINDPEFGQIKISKGRK